MDEVKMIEVMNQAVTQEQAAANLDAMIVQAASDLIGERTAATINAGLSRFGVAYRVQADDARLTDATIDLATAQDAAHKIEDQVTEPQRSIFVAAERLQSPDLPS